MSKGQSVLQLRVSDEMAETIYAELRRRNTSTKGEEWTVSDWLRAAVSEKLSHLKRSRKPRPEKSYPCSQCGIRYRLKDIAFTCRPLFGKQEYECVNCSRVGVNK